MKSHEKCPGEQVCTTNTIIGPCAKTGRSLEDICHDRKGGCRLYFTKDGITPLELRGMVQAAFVLHARQKAGLPMDKVISLYPYWAEHAYILANGIFAQVDQELADDPDREDDPEGTDFKITEKSDSGAFDAIREMMRENGLLGQKK